MNDRQRDYNWSTVGAASVCVTTSGTMIGAVASIDGRHVWTTLDGRIGECSSVADAKRALEKVVAEQWAKS